MAVVDFEERHNRTALLGNGIRMGVTLRISLQTHWHCKVGYYFQTVLLHVLFMFTVKTFLLYVVLHRKVEKNYYS